LWEIRETLNEQFKIHNFLYTITKNSCLNWLRNEKIVLHHQKNIRYLEMQYNYMALEKLGDWVEFEELSQKVQHAIAMLPEDLRETFLLSRLEELHYKEIAEKQSISIKTVEARISKTLKILRLELKDYLPFIFLLFNKLF
jgi:RNA polymerase sigma-70 factor (ECF subfamily)